MDAGPWRRRRLPLLAAALAFLLVAGACGSDDGDGESVAEAESAAEPTEVEWVEHETGDDCRCADGSEFTYWSRTADPDRVLLYFQGGGACFSPETCSFTDGTYLVQASFGAAEEGGAEGSGIFDFTNPDNPFRDWSVVFVPYCTGDVHIGNNVQDYGDGLTVNHVGFVNASHGLDHVAENFPDAAEVFVAGSSAGGVAAPLFGGLASDALPDAEVSVLSDGSGGYPDNPPVNAAIGTVWGAFENVPDWPVNEGLTREEWSIPGLFTQAGLHDPDIRMARYDNAYDEVQQQFSLLSGVGDGDVLTVVETNEENIEASGVPIHSYIAPGTDHTILGSDGLYELEVEGAALLDWLTRYVAGADVEDVRCADCGEPAQPGADPG